MAQTTSLAFFNNKGGVGKTTLSCNMAAQLAEKAALSILYVDCDPQCNATQLLLDDDTWEGLYSNKQKSTNATLLSVFKNIRVGDSTIVTDFPVVRSSRFDIDVLPGHPNLSTLEDTFSSSWIEFKAGQIGAARRSLWAQYLVQAADYDLVIFDLGPSLGALNRTVLLGCSAFVTPTAADLFSLYAVDNIGDWMKGWLREYRRAVADIDEKEPGVAEEWDIRDTPLIGSGYVGYTVQQYVSRSSRGGLRPVKAYDRYKKQIPARVKALADFTPPELDLDLGIVPNMFAMVPLAQGVHAPITRLTQADGLRGAQIGQQRKYSAQLHAIAERLMENLGLS